MTNVLLFLAGGLHALSFAPVPFPSWALAPLQAILLGLLVARTWSAPRIRAAAVSGLCFGVGNFLVGLYWVFISLHVYGRMAVWLAAPAVVLFALLLGLFPALAAALAAWLTPVTQATPQQATPRAQADGEPRTSSRAGSRFVTGAGPHGAVSALRRSLFLSFAPHSIAATLALCLIWAAAWSASEWLRGTLFTGFPWLNIGYAHVDGPLAGWAPVVGVYGVAFVAALCSAALAGIAVWRGVGRWAAAGTLAIVIAVGAIGRLFDWGIHPAGGPLAVRLVQGNVEQSAKFDPALIVQNLERHLQLAAQPSRDPGFKPDVIVLPETAIPLFQDQVPAPVWDQWTAIAAAWQAPLVTGIALHTSGGEGRSVHTNSVIGFTGETHPYELINGRVPWRYDKSHLVPFGEFIPFGFRWFVDAMVMPMGDFDRGERRQQPFQIADQHIAFNICYEDVFGEELLPAVRTSADGAPGGTILANVTNLGWFGKSLALPQHLQIARMRSLETGRPSIRATNTGVTAVINARGEVESRLPVFMAGVLDTRVQGTQGYTPYVRWGNAPLLLFVTLILGAAVVMRRRD